MTERISVLELIPQRPPFVFIDYIIEANATYLKAGYQVKGNTPLSNNNYFSEAGIVEFVAQSIAAHIGCTSDGEVKIGVIGSVKNFFVNDLPKAGDLLHAEIFIENKVFNVTLVKARVFNEEKEIAGGELKVALLD